jgi:cell wall-associated NlpC family hydrolase
MQVGLNTRLAVAEMALPFARLHDGSFVPARHLAEPGRFAKDFVAVAEQMVGAPYLWGGKTRQGLDCSGLVQTALHAAGIDCPRDSDMQQAELGRTVEIGKDLGGLERGDLVFWKGHVGMMVDGFLLLHANAHHMAVVIESLDAAVSRIARTGLAITAVKRIERAVA